MKTENGRRTPQPCRVRNGLAALLVGAFAAAGASLASAQVATFNLTDNTNLAPTPYKIFVTAFSTAGPYVLQPDGSWATPPVTSTLSRRCRATN